MLTMRKTSLNVNLKKRISKHEEKGQRLLMLSRRTYFSHSMGLRFINFWAEILFRKKALEKRTENQDNVVCEK